jgi:hypothetical protein
MALPTDISALLDTAIAGPFMSSAGNVYVFGRSDAATDTLRAIKATDPTSSFSAVGSDQDPYNLFLRGVSAHQVGDVIHIIGNFHSSESAVSYRYLTFNMATDAWVISEDIETGLDITPASNTDPSLYPDITVRSDGDVIVVYNGETDAIKGTSYARIKYARREGGTWTTNIAVDAGGQLDYSFSRTTLGLDDRVHIFWRQLEKTSLFHRTLSSANVLQAGSELLDAFDISTSSSVNNNAYYSAYSWDDGGTIRVAAIGIASDDVTDAQPVYFDSSFEPALNKGTAFGTSLKGMRYWHDDDKLYVIYASSPSNDLFIAASTDNGASFGTATNIYMGTVHASWLNTLKEPGEVYIRGGNYVAGYITTEGISDNKYNEAILRAATGTQNIDGALFTNTNTFFGATVSTGAVTISGALFTDGDTFFAATVAQSTTILGALYADDDTFYQSVVTATYAIAGALYSDADAFFGATISSSYTISGALFSDADAFFGATIAQSTTILGGLYSDDDTFYQSTVAAGTVTITGSLFSDGDTFFAATVAPGVATISGALFVDGDTFYQGHVANVISGALYSDPDAFFASTTTASYTISGVLYADADAFFAATISSTYAITGALYTDADTFFEATIASGFVIEGALFTDGDTFFGAALAYTINGVLYTDDDTFFAATVSAGASPQTIDGALFADGDVFFQAAITAAYTIEGALYADADTFFEATLSHGLSGNLYADDDTFFAATLTTTVTVTGAIFVDGDTIFGATVVSIYGVDGALFVDGDAFFAANLTAANTIDGVPYTDPDIFYGAEVVGGLPSAGGGGMHLWERRGR